MREIKNLYKLNKLGFEGAPTIYGSCIEPERIIYAVTRFTDSAEICKGQGIDLSCAMGQDVIAKLRTAKQPGTEALKFLEKVRQCLLVL